MDLWRTFNCYQPQATKARKAAEVFPIHPRSTRLIRRGESGRRGSDSPEVKVGPHAAVPAKVHTPSGWRAWALIGARRCTLGNTCPVETGIIPVTRHAYTYTGVAPVNGTVEIAAATGHRGNHVDHPLGRLKEEGAVLG
jgi:hypothetical protein